MLSAVFCVVAVLAQQEIDPAVVDNHVPLDFETFCEFLVEHEAATEVLDLNNCNGEDRRRLAEEQFPDAQVQSMSMRDEDTHFAGTTMMPPSMSGRRRMGDPAYAEPDDGLVDQAWYFYNSKPATKILVFDPDWWYVYWGCWSEEICRQLAMSACGSHCTIAAESGCTSDPLGTRQAAFNYYHPSSFDHYHWVGAQSTTDRALFLTCNGGFGWATGYGAWTDFMALYYCAYYNGWEHCEKVDRSDYVHAHHSVDNMEHHESRRQLSLVSDDDESRRELNWLFFWRSEEMADGSYPEVERQGSMECEIYASRWLFRYLGWHHDYFVKESSLPSVDRMKYWRNYKDARDSNALLKKMLHSTNAVHVQEDHWYWLFGSACHIWNLHRLPHEFTKDTGSPYTDEHGYFDAMAWFSANGVADKLNDNYPISITYKTRSQEIQGRAAHDLVLVGYQHRSGQLQWLYFADSSAESDGKLVWVSNGKDVGGNWIANHWERNVFHIRGRYIHQTSTSHSCHQG